jgi:radical SAM superfamily enzyme YgiQ (UPF0313 family)
VVLAFPNTYSVGITSLGYQVVWASLAGRADVDVRRLFTDQEEPPHRACDLFGLSLSWELDGPVLLDLLERRRIPLWSAQRGEQDPIVFGGGPVLTANPEPLAPFLDVVLLGDGELLLPAFIDAMQEHRLAPRPSGCGPWPAWRGCTCPPSMPPATTATACCRGWIRSRPASPPPWPNRPGGGPPSATPP